MRQALILRRLIRSFFADYLRLVEPEFSARASVRSIRFPRRPLGGAGVVAEVVERKGEVVTVPVWIEPEVLSQGELAAKVRQSLLRLRVPYGEPVLASVVYLRGGRPGPRLESSVLARASGVEMARLYVTTVGLEGARAEHYLGRPEPLAWALAAGMNPGRWTPEELRRACLDRITTEPLKERRALLRQAVESFLPKRPANRAASVSVQEGGGESTRTPAKKPMRVSSIMPS